MCSVCDMVKKLEKEKERLEGILIEVGDILEFCPEYDYSYFPDMTKQVKEELERLKKQ